MKPNWLDEWRFFTKKRFGNPQQQENLSSITSNPAGLLWEYMVKGAGDLKKLGVLGHHQTGHWQWRFFCKRTWREQKSVVTPEAQRLYIPYLLWVFFWNLTVLTTNFPTLFPFKKTHPKHMTRYRLDYSRPGGLGPRPPEWVPHFGGYRWRLTAMLLVGHC